MDQFDNLEAVRVAINSETQVLNDDAIVGAFNKLLSFFHVTGSIHLIAVVLKVLAH